MMGVVPGVVHPHGERLAGPLFAAIGIVVLAVCTIWAAGDHVGAVTLVVAGLSAAWLLLLVPLFPRRAQHPWLAVGFFAGLLAGVAALTTLDTTYTAFASIGYPIAFVLFAARWSIFAVTATAVVPLLRESGARTRRRRPGCSSSRWSGRCCTRRGSSARRTTNGDAPTRPSPRPTRGSKPRSRRTPGSKRSSSRRRARPACDERQRMAREIHDTLAQGLTGIVTQLQAADRASSAESRQRHLTQVHTLAKDSLTEARRAVQALRPEPLTDSRLPKRWRSWRGASRTRRASR